MGGVAGPRPPATDRGVAGHWFLRNTGLLRRRRTLPRCALPAGSPFRACGSRAPLKEHRLTVAQDAAGGCPAPVPRIPRVAPRRCAPSRASRSPRVACASGPTGAVPGARRQRPGTTRCGTSSAAPGIRHARCGEPAAGAGSGAGSAAAAGPGPGAVTETGHGSRPRPPATDRGVAGHWFLRSTGLHRRRRTLFRRALPAGFPRSACGSRAPLKEHRPASARRATGGCPAPVPRIPRVARRRCAPSRASRSPRVACASGPTGAVPGARRQRPGTTRCGTSSAAPGIRHARCGEPAAGAGAGSGAGSAAAAGPGPGAVTETGHGSRPRRRTRTEALRGTWFSETPVCFVGGARFPVARFPLVLRFARAGAGHR
jgi:hypothetical protein